jgi:hypothetical protein
MSCGTEDPISVGRPPVVNSFVPGDQSLDAFLGDTLRFQIFAVDPDQTSLKQRFSLDDSVVSDGSRWNYVVDDTGLVLVECVVTDGLYDSRIEWEVSRHIPVNDPPQIVAYQPVEDNPVMILGDEMNFVVQASDSDGDTLSFRFTLDDVVVSTGDDYLHDATDVGEFDIEAVVSDGEHFATHLWQLTITPEPDTIPPSEVHIVTLDTGDEPGELNLEWIAVGKDLMEGVASNYLVRTSPTPIIDEVSWSRGSERPGVPPSAAPGETMSMVLDGLTPAQFVFVAVRAVDDFGNLSPIGPSHGEYTRGMRIAGKVMDSITGLPMPDVRIDLAHYRTTTDLNGEFEFLELPPLDELLVVSDDGQIGYQYRVRHLDYIPVYLIPVYELESGQYDDFLTFFLGLTTESGIPYPRHQRRWEAPIDVYAPPFTNEGLDYQTTIHEAARGLNPHIGMDLFNVLDNFPPIGVGFVYLDDLMYDNYGVRVWSGDWYPLKATIEMRKVYEQPHKIVFERVVRHELGHALGVKHSEDTIHLMVGGVAPQVDTFSSDEIALIRTRFHIPRGIPLASYVWE